MATLAHGGTGPAILTGASYTGNPTGLELSAAGGCVDAQVVGAATADALTLNVYYRAAIQGPAEDALVLMYFTGTSWDPVFGTGHGVPAKDTTDNLDGTSSGGRFTLV